MDRSAFAREVAALSLGKRLPDAVYVHVDALPCLPVALQEAVGAAQALARVEEGAFQVARSGLFQRSVGT